MARKATNEPAPAQVASTKPVRVDLTDELHHMLRKVAADENVSMAAFAREIIERTVRDEFKKRGLK